MTEQMNVTGNFTRFDAFLGDKQVGEELVYRDLGEEIIGLQSNCSCWIVTAVVAIATVGDQQNLNVATNIVQRVTEDWGKAIAAVSGALKLWDKCVDETDNGDKQYAISTLYPLVQEACRAAMSQMEQAKSAMKLANSHFLQCLADTKIEQGR
jgi:hypothetical protein